MSNPHKGKSIHALIAEDVKGDAGYLVEELTMGFQRGESPEWFTREMVDLLSSVGCWPGAWRPGASLSPTCSGSRSGLVLTAST